MDTAHAILPIVQQELSGLLSLIGSNANVSYRQEPPKRLPAQNNPYRVSEEYAGSLGKPCRMQAARYLAICASQSDCRRVLREIVVSVSTQKDNNSQMLLDAMLESIRML